MAVQLVLSKPEARALLAAAELKRDMDGNHGLRDTLREDRGVAALAAAISKLSDALRAA